MNLEITTGSKAGFDAALKECLLVTQRSISEVFNGKMLSILKTARDRTPMGDRSKIQQELGATSTQRVSKKTGAIKTGVRYAATETVYKILNSQGIRRSRVEIGIAAKKFIGQRLRAVGSLKAGWNDAIRKFQAAYGAQTGFFTSTKTGGPKVKQKSIGLPAKDEFHATAVMEYRYLNQDKDGTFYLDPRVEGALQQAFHIEEASMKKHLEEKLAKAWKKF